jgi:hypothetical protein
MSTTDDWSASLQNNFGLRAGLLVRRVPFRCFPATVAHEKPVLQVLVEVAAVSFIGPTVLLAITIVSIFSGALSMAMNLSHLPQHHAIKNYRFHGGWGPEGTPLQPVSLLFLIAIFMDR